MLGLRQRARLDDADDVADRRRSSARRGRGACGCRRTTFLYFGCARIISTLTTIDLSPLSETTTPRRSWRRPGSTRASACGRSACARWLGSRAGFECLWRSARGRRLRLRACGPDTAGGCRRAPPRPELRPPRRLPQQPQAPRQRARGSARRPRARRPRAPQPQAPRRDGLGCNRPARHRRLDSRGLGTAGSTASGSRPRLTARRFTARGFRPRASAASASASPQGPPRLSSRRRSGSSSSAISLLHLCALWLAPAGR